MTRISGEYLLKRFAVSMLAIWGLATLIFFLLKAMPGDFAQVLTASPDLSEEAIAAIQARYGLNEPLWVQYTKFLRNYVVLDFGYSLQEPEPVVQIIARRLPRTLALFGSAFLLQYTIGIIAGIHFGWKRGSVTDKAGFMTGLTVYSIPFFWLAWLFLLVFSYQGLGITWFPTGRMTSAYTSSFGGVQLITDVLHHMVVPLFTLVFVGWGATMLVMRTSMQEVLDQGYIQTARAKGLPPTAVKYKHAARNALIPVSTQAIIAVVFFIDGSVIVETVFNWPGIGLMLVTAIQTQNFPVAMASFFILGALIIIARLLTDVVYTFIDPRIKFGETQ